MIALKKIRFLFLSILFLSAGANAYANPAFARRYSLSCSMCHKAFPKLNEFGEAFAANGYQMPGGEPADSVIDTGDNLLSLMKTFPVSLRVDSYMNWREDSDTNYDLKVPFGLKLISGSSIVKDISYYFYYYLSERGEVSGIEDGFIFFNNIIPDRDIDIMVGQFAVNDLIFPRETRLTREDFRIYKTKISDSGINLSYDRGIIVTYGNSLFDLQTGVVNGNGIGAADQDKNFDSDNFKNFFGRIGFDLFDVSIGFFGYKGREKKKGKDGINEFYRIGPDISFDLGSKVSVFANWLWGMDTNPEFTNGNELKARLNGGFAGAEILLSDRFVANLLYNRIYSREKPSKKVDLITANLTFYKQRNFKIVAEYTLDIQRKHSDHPVKENSLSLGIVTAF